MSQDPERLGPLETATEVHVRPPLDATPGPAPSNDGATVTEQATPRARPASTDTRRTIVTGSKIGRYVVEEMLGRGGMADVFAAHDTTLDRRVALKILRGVASDDARRQLLREAKLAARFEHPGSIVIYDVGEAEGVGFIAMEIVRGVPLSQFTRDPDVPVERRVLWLIGAARALAAAHEAGLVHRDVKPSNLMIRDSGEVKVLDFGIARSHGRAGEPSTGQRSFVGTIRYAAPEAFAGGSVDRRADQFSWGVVGWELLAGRHPLAQEPMEAVAKLLRDGVEPLETAAPHVPIEICEVIDRATARRPQDRYASLDEAADDLEPFAEMLARSSRTSFAEIALPAVDVAAAVKRAAGAPQALGAPPAAAPDEAPGADLSTPPESPAEAPARVDGPGATDGGTSPPRRRLWGAFALAAAAGIAIAATWRAAPPQAAPATVATPAAAPEAEITAVGCADAVVEGDDTPELRRALGMAACARLAPELGVDWIPSGAAPSLEVRADVRPARAVVTLRIAGREAVGDAAAPIEAVQRAVTGLARQLRGAPWPPSRVRLWGAADEASARRIERLWRLASTGLSPDLGTEVKRLVETDGDSPMPHLLALKHAAGGRDIIDGAAARTLERLDRLPPLRADAVRGWLLVFPAEQNRKEGIRLLREAYAAAPDDHTMTVSYAGVALRFDLPEAAAVIERLHAQAPSYSVSALSNAMTILARRDPATGAKYLRWMAELLPETLGRIHATTYLLSARRFDDARRGLDFAKRLGLDGTAADPMHFAGARAEVELASFAPAAAREHLGPLLADPRFYASFRGGLALVMSYLEEGRFRDAETALREQAERQRDQGNLPDAVLVALEGLRLARWLGRPVDPALRSMIERAVAERVDLPSAVKVASQVELAIAARATSPAEAALRALEQDAERDAAGDASMRDRALVLGVPLCRIARGDRAAAALWQRTDRAPFLVRRAASLDAALALEATGDAKGAEEAYLLAADPTNNAEDGLQRVLAVARLASLRRRAGRDAGPDAALLDEQWTHADADVRGAVTRLR